MARQLRLSLALLFASDAHVAAERKTISEVVETFGHHERPLDLVEAPQRLVPNYTKVKTPRPPLFIEDSKFIDEEDRITSVAEAFDKWGAELLLVDFFAYSHTKCMRTTSAIRLMYETFKPKGLRMLAFARPQFDFEGDLSSITAWMDRNYIRYPVAIDVNGTNWHAWNVLDWPTHFLVRRDPRSEFAGNFVLEHKHEGYQHHNILWNKIIKLLGVNDVSLRQPEIRIADWTDVELFLGTAHRSKNALASPLRLPRVGRFVVYGAGWCPLCTKSKIALQTAGASFDYVDMDLHGGTDAVENVLHTLGFLPMTHKILPIIFDTDSNYLGGYSDLLRAFPGIDEHRVLALFAIAKVETSFVEYNINSSKVSVALSGTQFWGLDREALTSRVDGANLTFQAVLKDARVGFAMYAVCSPGNIDAHGWLEFLPHCPNCVATKIDIRYTGRHYLGISTAASATVELRVSMNLRVYELWLTTEPHHPSRGT